MEQRKAGRMRLIDADAFAEFIKYAIKTQKYDVLKVNDTTLTVGQVLESVIAELDGTSLDGLKNNPTIEPRKGKWIKISPANIYECSVCGQNVMTNDIETYKFCHGCGADMRGDK